jgi:plastocyanin
VGLWLWGAPINASISRRLARLAALLSVALLMMAANAGAQSQNVVTVAIRDFYFEPSQLIIEPGTTVQWVNEGTTQHTVLATSPSWSIPLRDVEPWGVLHLHLPATFPKTIS